MGQKKGHTGNPNGRPKGAENITTREAKEVLNQVLFGEISYMRKALADLRRDEPGKYLDVLAKLLKYSIPAQAQNDININALTEAELDALCDNLIQKFNENEKIEQ